MRDAAEIASFGRPIQSAHHGVLMSRLTAARAESTHLEYVPLLNTAQGVHTVPPKLIRIFEGQVSTMDGPLLLDLRPVSLMDSSGISVLIRVVAAAA